MWLAKVDACPCVVNGGDFFEAGRIAGGKLWMLGEYAAFAQRHMCNIKVSSMRYLKSSAASAVTAGSSEYVICFAGDTD